MTSKQRTKHKVIKRDDPRKKDKIYKGVLPLRFASKDVNGNDVIKTSEQMAEQVEDYQW